MLIEVIRVDFGATCTIGKMYIDGTDTCYTLEDVVRPANEKVFGQTAIPYGRYRCDITYSPHFGVDLPLLRDVPNFQGVRIHPGNSDADTEGCLLVGLEQDGNRITRSREAFSIVLHEIRDAIESGEEVWIEIKTEA